jgi:hypothetical protein
MKTNNPFKHQVGWSQSVDDRMHDVKRFTLKQCRDALLLPGLQSTVTKAINCRIRKLEKANAKVGV